MTDGWFVRLLGRDATFFADTWLICDGILPRNVVPCLYPAVLHICGTMLRNKTEADLLSLGVFVNFETIIWDLDGTLTDSTPLHYKAWQETMLAHDIDYSYEAFLLGYGRNNFEILAEQIPSFSPAKISEVSEEKENAFRRLLHPGSLTLLPGVKGWLETCHAHGLRQVLGSSAPMANIVAMLHVLQIADFFQAVLSGYRVPRGKPDPLLFLRCAGSVESAPTACLVIEDSIYGIEAAHRAGMRSVAVGHLATSDAIRPYSNGNQPGCIAVPSLVDLAPQQVLAGRLEEQNSV